LSALPEFEITAVCTSRHEAVDETAKHFGGRSASPDFDVVVKRHQLLGSARVFSDDPSIFAHLSASKMEKVRTFATGKRPPWRNPFNHVAGRPEKTPLR
jgi:hypothetical protein